MMPDDQDPDSPQMPAVAWDIRSSRTATGTSSSASAFRAPWSSSPRCDSTPCLGQSRAWASGLFMPHHCAAASADHGRAKGIAASRSAMAAALWGRAVGSFSRQSSSRRSSASGTGNGAMTPGRGGVSLACATAGRSAACRSICRTPSPRLAAWPALYQARSRSR